MNENNKGQESFMGYEYKKVTVPGAQAAIYLDSYKCFGWLQDERFGEIKGDTSVTLNLRRDRKIINKMELTRLQRNFEASMEEIGALEKSKTSLPQIAALSTGIIGTAFMAGSTFAVTANPPIIWLCILLAIPGFMGWLLPYFLFNKLSAKKASEISPLVEEKYDEIYQLCQKGTALQN